MNFTSTPYKSRPPPGQQGSTPFRSASSANRFRSSLVPTSRPSPARSLNPSTKLSKTSTSSRDLFRTSTPQSTRTRTFSPDLPAEVLRPNASVRKFAPRKSVSTGMSNTASTEPFKMRIPSPDPELTGEAISKEIPDDPTRTGTVYTDQFLAHKCPPHFDDLQRRQFFCILDLRRLKYAANEIFAKKDWKLNILNFAKEYEKSRGMIMLRYGLYEFKNVKPSEEVLKKWRAAHGLPDPEPEESRPSHQAGSGSTKRKAEDDLAPKDNVLMASSTNQNKRRTLTSQSDNPALKGPAPFKTSKRKASEEPEENQPVKKPASAATSKFESILNNAQKSATPLKQSSRPSTLFGVSENSKPNPFQPANSSVLFGSGKATGASSGSVLSSHKIGSAPSTTASNIFSYLSESSANSSGNENGNADDADEGDDSESDQERDSEEQEPSAAASTGTSTPPVQTGSLFAPAKTSAPANMFGASSKSAEPSSKGGLFGRVQMGSNGQPLRATPTPEDKPTGGAMASSAPKEVQSQTPAKAPGDFTFNPATTPISFGQPTSDLSSSVAAPKAAEPAKTKSLAPEKSTSLFGSTTGSKPASSMFGSSEVSKPKATSASTSILATQAPSTPSIFAKTATTPAAASSLFKPQEKADGSSSVPNKKQAVSIFDKPAAKTPAPAEQKPLFAAAPSKEASTTPAPTSKGPPSIFDKSFIAQNAAQPPPKIAEAGDNFWSRGTNPLFSSAKATPEPSTKPASTNGQEETHQSAISIFGQTGSDKPKEKETTNSSIFTSKPSTFAEKPLEIGKGDAVLFGAKKPEEPAKPEATSIFGTKKTEEPAKPAASSIFGVKKPEETTKAAPSIFGSNQSNGGPIFSFGSQPTNTQASSATLGATPTASPAVSFGASNSQTNGNAAPKIDFSFGSGASTPSFTFGQDSSSNIGGFTFSAGGGGSQSVNNPFTSSQPNTQPSAPSFGGISSTTTPSSSFNFSFGQQPPSTPSAQPPTQGTGTFGGVGNTNNGPSFSFTSATPGQSPAPAKSSAPPSIFSSFQGGSLGPVTAGSPFPAPSSIGTTPVNGTPEPQTANDEDAEATQEQISLTEGGPGEEDETLVYEVRAKAIKFIPVNKDDPDEKNKSPWSTRGVGPLRILKNKTTGAVRILLRAEPRGHVAINKTILPNAEYKVKDKTVNFAAASDDGSGLETWVLQVKKPEFAAELAKVLEENKAANNK